jgi:hypothetical protein
VVLSREAKMLELEFDCSLPGMEIHNAWGLFHRAPKILVTFHTRIKQLPYCSVHVIFNVLESIRHNIFGDPCFFLDFRVYVAF